MKMRVHVLLTAPTEPKALHPGSSFNSAFLVTGEDRMVYLIPKWFHPDSKSI